VSSLCPKSYSVRMVFAAFRALRRLTTPPFLPLAALLPPICFVNTLRHTFSLGWTPANPGPVLPLFSPQVSPKLVRRSLLPAS